MINNTRTGLQNGLIALLMAIASLALLNCQGGNKEASKESSAASADSSFMGRQGDTLNSSAMDAPQQAPVDSTPGAVVPAQVNVRVKK
ncbi:MAG TPA: hypothetical protein VK364_12505 [Hymenobacter sp.]|jgi:hypothetical protein|nr:hypothetical protein [Hymenobacter sp.]HLL96956.1 hypothetical protein [Spirosoma sp.]